MVHTFRCLGRDFALDCDSGTLLQLDEHSRVVVELAAQGRTAEEIKELLRGRFDQRETEEILGDVERLRAEGQLFAKLDLGEYLDTVKPLKAMCLHVSHDCDLRCRYCFAGTGSFSARRSLMSAEVGRRALDFLVERSGERKLLEVDFFGGEPLLNFGVVKELVDYGRATERRTGKRIAFTLTTNGTRLTPEISEYLNREMVNLVLSIDGRPEVHDAMRPHLDGSGSHAGILPRFLELVAKRGDKDWYARGTFTRRNLDFSKDVLYLYEAGFRNISVEPAVLPEESSLSLRGEDLPGILEEYERLAEALASMEDRGERMTFFHFTVDLENGPCIKKRLSGCGAGSEYVAVTPEGDVYPCHQFVGRGEYRLGDIFGGPLNQDLVSRFQRAHVLAKDECASCWARLYCTGGCAANAQAYSGDILRPNPIECAMQRKRLECALALYTVRQGQSGG